MNNFSHSTGENRTLRFAFTSDEAKKMAQSETQAYLASIAPKAVPTAQTGASPNYGTVDLKSRTYSTTPMSTSYTNTTGKLTPDNSTYGTPISTAPTTFTKPAFTNLADAQKAQQEYYLKNGSTSASIAADITNLGGGSGDFNQVDPYKLQTPVASQPTIVNDPQRDIKVPGTGTFTVASAKYDLATSRDPRVKTAAQEFLNAEQNKVKGYVDRSWTDPETGATYVTKSEDPKATEQAQQQWLATQAQDQANRLKSQEQADKLKKFVSGIDTSALDQTTKQMNDLLGSIKNLSPDLQASVLPQLLQLQQSNNEVTKMAQEMITAQPTDEQITANYGTLEKYIESQDTKFKDILAKNLETSKEIAQYHKDSLEIDKKIIEHDAAVAEQKQIAANTQNEKQLRRQLNRLGLQTDTSGLDYLQTEIQKGATALEELKTGNNLVMLKANLAIGEGYRLEVKQAMETYEGNYLNITSQTTEKLQSIKNSISSAKSDRAKNIIEAKKWELEQKQENDKEARKTISDAQKTMSDNVNKLRDDERTQEQLGINMLDKLVDTYGNNVPPSLLETVKKYIPNIDIQDVMKRRTLAQMKKGAGGGGVGGINYTSGSATSSAFSNVTPQQLSEAVQRAFAPGNYGGTAGERASRLAQYQQRIRSGENPSSIMESLANDYWASQKGAGKTSHTERVTSQGSAESLQSFVDYYGINGSDDGVLGSFDSRVQGFFSIFGMSSEQYNNLATNVGNIRARIIKENYGAAVTPQELNIAKSYIPSMTDKGAQFVTKLQNLKAYQGYLDAKVTADALGLPSPLPPSPITLSGDKVSGPSKYSTDDINSTIQ